MIKRPRIELSPRRRKALLVLFGVIWTVIFLVGALPAVRESGTRDEKIQAASSELANLSQWATTGIWLDQSIAKREPQLCEEYNRLFPAQKQIEALYLELARVAKQSDIESLGLTELDPANFANHDQQDDDEYDDYGDEDYCEDDVLMTLSEQYAPDQSHLPNDKLEPYRLRAAFEADYERMARFIAGLRSVSRGLAVQRLHVEPVGKGILVEMELEFYVQHAR